MCCNYRHSFHKQYFCSMSLRFNKLVSYSLILFACVISFAACQQIDVFEKNTTIPDYTWSNKFTATGSFVIADTVEAYNIYIVLRHLDAYKYNNIWLNVGLQSPGDSMYFQKVNVSLGNDAGWDGTGMNDIWAVKKLVNGQPRRFIKTGLYHFSIAQIMRDEPLRGIMDAGLRLEKVH